MGRKTKINSITSSELLAQVNPENKQLLIDFLEYCRSIQLSETTIAGYKSDIEIFFVWNLKNNSNKSFIDCTKRNIVAYQNWLLNENENSPARIRRLKSSLSSMSNYIADILDDEYPNFRNIINKVKNPVNQPVREKTVLSDIDVENILIELTDKSKYKTACYVALAAYGGRRKAEICRFRMSDFAEDKLVCGGSLWKSDPIKTKGRANGKYISCYTLVSKFKPYLDLWVEDREKRGIKSEWLFPDEKDPSKHMEISTANSYMQSLCRLTGLNIYAHAFRHYYTTMLSNQGLPDSVIKEILGWEDVTMVSVYNDRSAEDTLDMYFDKDGIKDNNSKGLSDL